jgi:hypothetical protein
LIDDQLVYFAGNQRICLGKGMNPLQRWQTKKPRRPPRSPLLPQAEYKALAAGATLPETSMVEGKYSTEAIVFPIE